jgi:hypothetical protein
MDERYMNISAYYFMNLDELRCSDLDAGDERTQVHPDYPYRGTTPTLRNED